MNEREYDRGHRDGELNVYRPPHDKGLIGELLSGGYTDKELEDRRDYGDGFDDGFHGR